MNKRPKPSSSQGIGVPPGNDPTASGGPSGPGPEGPRAGNIVRGSSQYHSLLADPLSRRRFLTVAGGAGLTVPFLAACGSSGSESTAASSASPSEVVTNAGTVKIGWVSPITGGLAALGATDDFIISGIEEILSDGLAIGGKPHGVEIIRKDSESSPDTAASVALELINQDNIDLMVVGNTPGTTNPVSDQCEANGVPCISSLAPWEPWFFGRGGDPAAGFSWTYHFFFGIADFAQTLTGLWAQIDTNRQVGALYPNDADGNAVGDPETGMPAFMAEQGYTFVDPGRYENLNQDFTAQLNAFKAAECEIVTGVMIPPDFPTFWSQAKQQAFGPKIVTVGKALLFPEAVAAVGPDAEGLSSEIWWSPKHPYASSLIDVTAGQLAESWTEATGNQWTQPLGYAHALFEVAVAALSNAASTEPQAIIDSIASLRVDTIVGTIDWTSPANPVPNVALTKLVGGQWRTADTPTGFDLFVVDNTGNPAVPVTTPLEILSS